MRVGRARNNVSLNRELLLQRMDPTTPWDERLVIEPYFQANIVEDSASVSIDFHLGSRFMVFQSSLSREHDLLSQDPAQDIRATDLFIPLGKVLTLRPGNIVLGTTLEWFRFPLDLMANVVGRSIWGRRGLLIVTASVVRPGSSGTITLEMSNLSDVGLNIRPGVAIGQLFFSRVEGERAATPKRSYFSGALRPIVGKYTLSRIEELLLNLK
jgi:dCTP deaminase